MEASAAVTADPGQEAAGPGAPAEAAAPQEPQAPQDAAPVEVAPVEPQGPEPVPGSVTLSTGQTREVADVNALDEQIVNGDEWVTVNAPDGSPKQVRASAIIERG